MTESTVTPMQRELNEARKERLKRIASIGKMRQIEANRSKLFEVPVMEPTAERQAEPELTDVAWPAHLTVPEFDLSKVPPGKLMIADIQRYVAQKYGLKRFDLICGSQRMNLVGPRQIAMYLSVRLLGRTLTEIGRMFRRDHTTVLHSVRRTKERVLGDSAYCLAIGRMEEELAPYSPPAIKDDQSAA